MISIQNVAMSFGSKLLFDDVSLHLSMGRRYGLVGANGAGKSTFLRLLMGCDEPIAGEFFISKNTKIGWLKQDQDQFLEESIISVVLRGNVALWRAIEGKEKLLEKDPLTDQDINKLAHYEEELARLDGYTARSKAENLLEGLGVSSACHDSPLKTLSGGYKLRVLLARTLFDNPDVLLLDEPTNYLDIVTISWLARYLTHTFKGMLIVTSHDHYFINEVCNYILDIDYGEIRSYTGNFDQFSVKKEEVAEQKEQERKSKQKYYDRMQAFIDRFKAKATKAKQALSREKQLAKLEWPKLDISSRRHPKISFLLQKKSGKVALTLKELCKSFNDLDVITFLNLQILRGEKVGVLGPNGVGKSTLVKLIIKALEPTMGEVLWGNDLKIGYFAQESYELLKGKKSTIEWLEENTSQVPDTKLRNTLGKMLFSKDEQHKTLNILSGGEKARLILAQMMLTDCNFLILDEPTNHLDLEGRESLADALKEFKGTVFFVSHDQVFVERIATRILYLNKQTSLDFQGNLHDFVSKYPELNFQMRS